MIDIQSGDVAAMRDATVTDLVDELNKKQAQIPFSIVAVCGPLLVVVLALLQLQLHPSGQSFWVIVGGVAFVMALPAWAAGEWFEFLQAIECSSLQLGGRSVRGCVPQRHGKI